MAMIKEITCANISNLGWNPKQFDKKSMNYSISTKRCKFKGNLDWPIAIQRYFVVFKIKRGLW
jgi:hypothetical protein